MLPSESAGTLLSLRSVGAAKPSSYLQAHRHHHGCARPRLTIEFRDTVSETFETNSSAGPRLGQIDPPVSAARLALTILLAVAIPALAILAYVRFERKPATATGEIARLAIYPVHTQIHGAFPGAPGMAGQDESYDQMLVLAHVQLHNDNTTPMTVDDDWAMITLPDGETRRSLGASGPDFDKVFLAYPQLAPLRIDPLRRHTQIPPHQSVDGLLIFSYPLTQQQWDSRKAMAVTISFANAPELTLHASPN